MSPPIDNEDDVRNAPLETEEPNPEQRFAIQGLGEEQVIAALRTLIMVDVIWGSGELLRNPENVNVQNDEDNDVPENDEEEEEKEEEEVEEEKEEDPQLPDAENESDDSSDDDEYIDSDDNSMYEEVIVHRI